MEAKEWFDNFCQQVELEEKCKEKAWNVWESVSLKIQETSKNTLIPWFICAIYVTNCDTRFNSAQQSATKSSCSLSKLLREAKISMVEFFKVVKQFSSVWKVGSPVTDHLTEVKKTFCISAALFHKFQRVMPVVFRGCQDLCDSEERRETLSKTCWLLYLVYKGWNSNQVKELMTAFNLLLCCVDYVHNKFVQQLQTGEDLSGTNIQESVHDGILPNLCEELTVPLSNVALIYSQHFKPFLEKFFEGNARNLVKIGDLNSIYEEVYTRSGDVDERDFFDKNGYLWIPFNQEASKVEHESAGTLNGGTPCTNTSLHDEFQPVLDSSKADSELSRNSFPQSSSSLTDLRTTLEERSHLPGQELIRFWGSCRRNPLSLIQAKLTSIQDCFLKGFDDTAVCEGDSNISIQIFVLAKKLYYRVMEAMLLAEEKRLSCSDFSALLNSEAFHVSLLACSLEVVMADKGLSWPTLAFPWILGILKLEAFDFFKVTESFILHEPLLNSSLIKHINRIEEQVLENLAWKLGSPLLKAMEIYHPHSDPGAVGSVQQQKKSQPLDLFLRRVNQLAYHRLTTLCNKLDISDTLVGHMWTCLEQSLKLQWQLMVDRHLDQMFLCAVYAISKVVGKEIQFKQIVTVYKRLPFSSAQVYKGTSCREQQSIIEFYNKVYMVTMKSTILQFAPNKNPPVSPAPRSAVRVPGKKNFYLSPLRSSPGETLTPKSRSSFSFGESPGSADRESLSRINASVRAAVHSQPKVPQKRLRFDDCDQTEPGPVLTNGHSTEKETGSHLNGTRGSKEEEEKEDES
ncbi:retinoblastoma-associated protein-like isoform X3 [Stylophora pistillata]|uniref:retinoblastoma-associated protein-like isoform X3 n=1 Tax=Stylophora pistillata TaxID=50429 RepID=UPI000C0470BB|nr:retinoblastoma-associated protein-like isoform X3 [Stylophora pistillata]